MADPAALDLQSRQATLAHLSPQNAELKPPGYLVLSSTSPPERIVRLISNILDGSSNVAAELGCASVLCGLTSDDAELGDVGVVEYIGLVDGGQVPSYGVELAKNLGFNPDNLEPSPITSQPLPAQLISTTQSKVTPSLLKGLQSYLGSLEHLHEASFSITEDREVYLLWGFKEGWLVALGLNVFNRYEDVMSSHAACPQ